MQEQDLIARSQDGELAAFNDLVELYQATVYNLAYRIVGSAAAAEDATQETFISAFRAIGTFRGGSFRGWLMRIATNAAYDQLRSVQRRPASSLEAKLEDTFWEPSSKEASPEEQALNAELAGEIGKAIATLPPDQRAVLVLADVEGFSYEDVAQAVRYSLGTVKSRLSRARARIRDYFAERRELLPDSLRL